MARASKLHGEWTSPQLKIRGESFTCANCEHRVAPHHGFQTSLGSSKIRICPNCNYPTLIVDPNKDTGEPRFQIPAAPLGRRVEHLPENVERFYSEARRCGAVEAWSAVALLCRTLLIHVAVDKGAAKQKDSFEAAIDGLDAEGWVPPNGKPWVEAVRNAGNKAAHKADPLTQEEAERIMKFVELLLRTAYEAPTEMDKASPVKPSPSTATS